MIGLIDYGSGNLRSVQKALEHEGGEVFLVDEPGKLENVDSVLLPGVGAFGDCVRNLRSRELWEPLAAWMESGKPFLGICVGYQLLFERSEEDLEAEGFGYFKGAVKKFHGDALKVPQMGWNTLDIPEPRTPLWRGLPEQPYVYFLHSYYPDPENPAVITSRATYGQTYAASAACGNVAGVQFHPEKSQAVGLTVLRNFINTTQ